MLQRNAIIFLCVITLCGLASAADKKKSAPGAWAEKVKFKKLYSLGAKNIPNGVKAVPHSTRFPALKRAKDQRGVLRFRLRADGKRSRNPAHALVIALNEHVLTPKLGKGPRSINRSAALHIKKKNKERGVSLWGKAPTKKTALLAYYAKIWKKLSSTFKTDREEKFWYVLDITDLVVYADAIDADQAATANRITFSNHLVKAKAKDRKVMLRMNDVAVGLISAADARAQIKRKLPPLYADGVFKGQAKVKKATCHVAVTFKNNRIVKIEILKPQAATHAQKARTLVPKLLKAQPAKVDVVAGATYASEALFKAMQQARAAAATGAEKKP